MSLDKLDGSYIRGYTAGLKKALEIVVDIEFDLKRFGKRYNSKSLSDALKVAIKDREILRENPNAFVRYTNEGKFEVYEPKE